MWQSFLIDEDANAATFGMETGIMSLRSKDALYVVTYAYERTLYWLVCVECDKAFASFVYGSHKYCTRCDFDL
jgi:hypothetical protein